MVIAKDIPQEKLDKILRQHVWGAIAVCVVPIPLFDLAALTGVQINLARKLANEYEIPFFKDTVKNIVSLFVGSFLPVMIAPGFIASAAKVIPFWGQTIGVMTLPVMAGAATYALGKVFIQHFASGGTLLTLDPVKVKAYYAEMFEEGKTVATDVQKAEKTRRK